MPYHTQDEWLNLLTDALRQPADWRLSEQWFHQMLCDFEALGYPDDTQWSEPLLLAFKSWVLQQDLLFSHPRMLALNAVQDGDQYQRVGDLAARLSEKLALPQSHPGLAFVAFDNPKAIAFQLVQRRASWRKPESHQTWLQRNPDGLGEQAIALGVAAAWPLFLHFLQWGVLPTYRVEEWPCDLRTAVSKWQGLAAAPTFVTWCFLQRAADAVVAVDAWHAWVSTLPADHAAHTLAVPRAFQAYDLWASCQTAGQLENWLFLVQMLEPAPAAAPTENSPVADLAL